jgi:hypothetical protein
MEVSAMPDNPKYFTRDEAATYLEETWGLRCSKASLAKFAVSGDGPAYHRSGREAFYNPAVLNEYAKRRLGPAASAATDHKASANVGETFGDSDGGMLSRPTLPQREGLEITTDANLLLPGGELYTCRCGLCTPLDGLAREARSDSQSARDDNAAIAFEYNIDEVAQAGLSQDTVECDAVQLP